MSDFNGENLFFFDTTSIPLTPTQNSLNKHMHNRYELYFFLSGNVEYLVGTTFYRLRPNDLLLIPPATYHCPRFLTSAPYHRIVYNFTQTHISNSVLASIANFQTHYYVTPNSAIDKLYSNLPNVIDEFNKEDTYLCLVNYLNLILMELKYSYTPTNQPPPKKIHPKLDEILHYIDENIGIPLNIDIITKHFSVSRSWLTHIFHDLMNIGVMQYVNYKKILYAQQLIEDKTSPIEAAQQSGFENYSTFYLQYKSILGINPSKSKNS